MLIQGEYMLKLLVVTFGTLGFVLSGCATPEKPFTMEDATQAWMQYYGGENCYAPRDYGTSKYPTDYAMLPDSFCTRTVLLEVENSGDGNHCYTSVRQSSWKFSDDPGFGETDMRVSRNCHTARWAYPENFSKPYYLSGAISQTELGVIYRWPDKQ